MGRVTHFEIEADDPARAIVFYEKVFGWEVQKWQDKDYWMVVTGKDTDKGINGGITPRRGDSPPFNNPVSAYVCLIDVDDMDDACSKVVQGGGNVIVDKKEIPGFGWLCYCKDTEGNVFGMSQEDAKTA